MNTSSYSYTRCKGEATSCMFIGSGGMALLFDIGMHLSCEKQIFNGEMNYPWFRTSEELWGRSCRSWLRRISAALSRICQFASKRRNKRWHLALLFYVIWYSTGNLVSKNSPLRCTVARFWLKVFLMAIGLLLELAQTAEHTTLLKFCSTVFVAKARLQSMFLGNSWQLRFYKIE
jgi:hypothetical protein